MNKLDEKIYELEMITDNDELLDACIDLLLSIQKDFNKAMMSKDADILLLEMGNAEMKAKLEKSRDGFKERLHAIIKYLEGKVYDFR